MSVDRRAFLRGSLAAGGALVVARSGVANAAALAPRAPGPPGRRPALPTLPASVSGAPCSFTVSRLVQNAVGLPDAVVNAFYAPQGSAYSVRFSWTPSGGILYGQLLFRMKDWSNYYALSFYPTEVGFSTYANGVWADKVRAYRPIDSTHPATLTLVLSGATFKVNDNAVTGSPTIMTWTDPNNLFPTGIAVVPLTNVGTNAVWDSIAGKPG